MSRLAGLLLLVSLLGACATWSAHGVSPGASHRIRVAVLPIQTDVDITDLRSIETVPGTEPVQDEKARIQARLQLVTRALTADLETDLLKSPYIERVSSADVEAALAGEPLIPLTDDKLARLRQALQVRAVLVVRLSGYGSLKRKWITYLIGSGVVEGIVEGALAWKALDSPVAGLLVGGEEIGQEILTWGGGAYLFNRHYSPVIFDGSLISTRDGKEVWDDTAYESIDTEALAKLPKQEQEMREVQLQVTAAKALQDLVKDLDAAARRATS